VLIRPCQGLILQEHGHTNWFGHTVQSLSPGVSRKNTPAAPSDVPPEGLESRNMRNRKRLGPKREVNCPPPGASSSDGPVQGQSPDGSSRPVRGKGFALFRVKGATYLGEMPDPDTGPIPAEDWEPSMQFIALDGLPLFEWVDNEDV